MPVSGAVGAPFSSRLLSLLGFELVGSRTISVVGRSLDRRSACPASRRPTTSCASRSTPTIEPPGTAIDRRQLKHRARDTVRMVPIPPVLVALLRDHIGRFGTAADGRLFHVTWGQRGKGGVVSTKVYGPAWQKARAVALTKAQQASPLAGRPYDLRHGGVTLALNAGVPAPEVAARAGHSVEVLWRVYAGCVHGQEKLWNRRIEEALTDDEDTGNDPPDSRGT